MPVRGVSIVIALAVLPVAGCGSKKPTYNDRIEGTITLDGKPLSGVHIDFMPDGELSVPVETARGRTDEKGHFELTRDSGIKGGYIGANRVAIMRGRQLGGRRNRDEQEGDDDSQEAPQPTPDRRPIPRTPQNVEVTADQHTYDIKLQSSTK